MLAVVYAASAWLFAGDRLLAFLLFAMLTCVAIKCRKTGIAFRFGVGGCFFASYSSKRLCRLIGE
jgi:hypothetical protein